MKYVIESEQYFKRNRWFINDEFGIAVDYWFESSASVTLDDKFVNDDDEFKDLKSGIEALEYNEEDEDQICLDYPCPWYLDENSESINWSLPRIPELINEKFKISLSGNFIFGHGADIEKKENRQRWTTWDSDFLWTTKSVEPSMSQKLEYHKKLATVWTSGCWKSDEDLNKFMNKEFGMQIEDDLCYFFAPSIKELL
jgi:hypothetical protein